MQAVPYGPCADLAYLPWYERLTWYEWQDISSSKVRSQEWPSKLCLGYPRQRTWSGGEIELPLAERQENRTDLTGIDDPQSIEDDRSGFRQLQG